MSAEIGGAVAAVTASAAALAALADAGPVAGDELWRDADPLLAVADACLDGLAEVARGEAGSRR